MVKATFIKDDENKKLELKLKGHAKACEEGHDLVCSSASILAYTFAQIVSFMDKQGKLAVTPKVKLKEGDTVIKCEAKDDSSYAEALHSLYVVQVGYSLLAHNYPQNVELKVFGETKKS